MEPLDHIRNVGEKRAQLYRNRDRNALFDVLCNLEVHVLDFRRRQERLDAEQTLFDQLLGKVKVGSDGKLDLKELS